MNYHTRWYQEGWRLAVDGGWKIPGVIHFSQARYVWVLSRMAGWENWRSVAVVIGSTTRYENHWENVNVWTPDVVCPTRLGVQCRQFDPVSGPFSMNNERSKLYFYPPACLHDFSFPVHCVYVYNLVMSPLPVIFY